MKHLTIIAAMMLAFTVSAAAHRNAGEDWKEKMMSEKIAFLTVEMGLTPEEAQTFWPIYTEVNKAKDAATHKVFRTYKKLKETMEAGKSEKEVAKALDKYLDALEDQREMDDKAADKFRKALPVEKVAKLYLGEEKFRRQHIRKMRSNHGHKPEAKK